MSLNKTAFIKRIEISNFRGIKNCAIDNLGQVNILIGANDAGKSTILNALYLTSAWITPLDELHDKSKVDYVISRRTGR